MLAGNATMGQSLRPMDTVANADDIAVWDRNNHISKMQIFMTLEHAVANLYDDKAVASELWNALRARFEGKGLVAVAALAAQLWRYVMLPDKDMTVQVQEIKSIALKLKNLRFPLSEEYQTIAILIALPHKWSTLHTIILNKSGSLSLQDTIDSILKHETTLWQQKESAMIVHNRPKSRSPAPPNVKSQDNKKSFCTNCKNEGHNIAQCWSVGGGSEGKAPKWRKSKSDLKGKQKGKLANVARDNRSPSPSPFTTYILHTNEDAHIAQDPSSSLN